eukprot:TRINITY_DN12862_c0_g2_i2.p1 TRINITY_DN12862_c0_g2~~TRINITY_DN12862_c0_g2_i2.p1  ORF type:complete len:627 (+),score=162.46 TRINITY_DN12862_c0_g2_i2:124-1881(+)
MPVGGGLLPFTEGTRPWVFVDLRNPDTADVAVRAVVSGCCADGSAGSLHLCQRNLSLAQLPGAPADGGVSGVIGGYDTRRFSFPLLVAAAGEADGGWCNIAVAPAAQPNAPPERNPPLQLTCPPGARLRATVPWCELPCSDIDSVPAESGGCRVLGQAECVAKYGGRRPSVGRDEHGVLRCMPPEPLWRPIPALGANRSLPAGGPPSHPDDPQTLLEAIPLASLPPLMRPPPCGPGRWDAPAGRCSGCPSPECSLPQCRCSPADAWCTHGDSIPGGGCACHEGWRNSADAFQRGVLCDVPPILPEDEPPVERASDSDSAALFPLFLALLAADLLLWAAGAALCLRRQWRRSAARSVRAGLVCCGLLKRATALRMSREEEEADAAADAALAAAKAATGESSPETTTSSGTGSEESEAGRSASLRRTAKMQWSEGGAGEEEEESETDSEQAASPVHLGQVPITADGSQLLYGAALQPVAPPRRKGRLAALLGAASRRRASAASLTSASASEAPSPRPPPAQMATLGDLSRRLSHASALCSDIQLLSNGSTAGDPPRSSSALSASAPPEPGCIDAASPGPMPPAPQDG